jgi:tetratricopeptide (TPR) repeat protein
MADTTKTEGKGKPDASNGKKDWKELLYTQERVKRFAKGEMTLGQLDGVSGPEMLEMAVTGFAMYEQGRYREARVIFEGLAALDPKESYYRTALGAVYLAQDKLDDARAQFDAAIELNDKDIAAFVNRGEVHLRQSRIIEAANDFKRAVDLDPENKDPLSLRARALAAAALDTLEKSGVSVNGPEAGSKKGR